MTTVAVLAPHPDDETLGAGGTLLRHRSQGDEVHWVIATQMSDRDRFPATVQAARDREIDLVAGRYGFAGVHQLGFAATHLDEVPRGEIVASLAAVFREIEPDIVYLPHGGDVHTEHRIMCEAGLACTKWFRFPSVRRVLAYETPSETEFGGQPYLAAFTANVFVDIGAHLEEKIAIAQLYGSEIGEHPFPRSTAAIRAQATLRGAVAGVAAAEAFMLIRDVVSDNC